MASTPQHWYSLGEQALKREHWAEAEAALWECLALQPRHAAALHLLGRLRARQGRRPEAIRLQRESTRCDPGLGWNAFALAELLEEQNDWPAAAGAMAAAAAALPHQPWIARRRQRLEGLAALDGETLADGLGPAAYRYWRRHLEPPLPPVEPADPLPGWQVCVGAGAQLRAGALGWVAAELKRRQDAGERLPDGLYADEDLISPTGERFGPWFKPGWQPESFWSTPWLDGLSVWRLDWLQQAGVPPPPAAPDALFAWQLQALACQPRLVALPRILVHCRAAAGGQPSARPAIARSDLLHRHLRELGEAVTAVTPHTVEPPGSAQPGGAAGFRFTWALPCSPPLVSVIVPSRDRPDLLAACLDGVDRAQNPRLRLEVWVVDNGSRQQASAELQRRWQERPGLRAGWLDGDGPFNWSLLNNGAARAARGDLLLFLNNDVHPLQRRGHHSGWLESLAAQALRPVVGCAGALLLTPAGRLQHAGVLPGLGRDGCAHPYRDLPPDHHVHRSRSSFLTTWPALTGACLMVRRPLFLEAGGFDPALPVEGNDVDFCLRLGAFGLRHVLTPEAVLVHAEGSSRHSRGDDRAARHAGLTGLRQRWPAAMAGPGLCWPAASSALHHDGRPRELQIPGWD